MAMLPPAAQPANNNNDLPSLNDLRNAMPIKFVKVEHEKVMYADKLLP